MTFTDRDLLLLAIALPLLIAFFIVRYARRRRRVAAALAESRLLARIGGGGLHTFPWLRAVLLVSAAVTLGLAAAGPRWGLREIAAQSRSRNVVFAIDISKSMLVRDVQPSRLERARLLARRALRELTTDRLGLVVFAGRAYILSPLTTDHGALALYVDALDPEMVSQGGSSLASALSQATDLARGPSGRASNAAVVLISDGEALEEQNDIAQAAARAARFGIVVHTVGVGTAHGGRIPEIEPGTRRVLGYKQDPYGNTVVSKLEEQVLQSVAQETGGRYFNLETAGSTSALLRQLRELERTGGQSASRTERKDQTIWFIAAALALLFLDVLLARGATQRAVSLMNQNQRVRIAAIITVALGLGFGIGVFEKANRLYRAGKYEEAVRLYRQALREGEDSPELRYNLGTALVQLGKFDEADEHLQQAVRARNADVRQRAHFNTGYRSLVTGRNGGEGATERLAAAIESYKHALRLNPRDVDAKWNLEMALREQEKQQQSPQQNQNQPQNQGGGGQDQNRARSGGAGSNQSQSPSGQGTDQGQNMQQRPMSQEQADRILSAIEQDERQLTREKLRKGQRRTAVARDW